MRQLQERTCVLLLCLLSTQIDLLAGDANPIKKNDANAATAEIQVASGMIGAWGDHVDGTKKGQPDSWRHFVATKDPADNPKILLIATVKNAAAGKGFDDYFVWSGGIAVAGFQGKRREVSRKNPGKNEIKILDKKGNVVDKLIVWVVWSAGRVVNSPNVQFSRSPNDTCLDGTISTSAVISLTSEYRFIFKIEPSTIITDADRPNLSGAKNAGPPGGTSPFSMLPLAGGASKKWDVSRRMRVQLLNPNLIPKGKFTTGYGIFFNNQPKAIDDAVGFPLDDVVGNDDSNDADEDNNPYQTCAIAKLAHGIGEVSSYDPPTAWMPEAGAKDKDTFEWHYYFGEFLRLEIGNKWYRISDFKNWNLKMKIKYDTDKWINNGSSTGEGN